MRRAFLLVVAVFLLVPSCGSPSPSTADTAATSTSSTTTPFVPTTDATPATTRTSTTTEPVTPSTVVTSTTGPDTTPPVLAVIDPPPGATVTEAAYRFSGTTEPGARVVAAGRYEAEVDAGGAWSIVLLLDQGGNVATISAIDTAGNESSVSVPVYRVAEPNLVGEVLDAVWVNDRSAQVYMANGAPTGWTSGARIPLTWRGDEVALQLGFAVHSDLGGERGPFDTDFDGAVLLLESAGQNGTWDRYLVRDEVAVFVPAGRGFVAAMCFEGDVAHAVRLAFTDEGPRIEQAWRVDLLHKTLTGVDPGLVASCPDLRAAPPSVTSDGAIVTAYGSHAVVGDDHRGALDISGSIPVGLDRWEIGGTCIAFDGRVIGHALGWEMDAPTPETASEGWLWLEAFLGWDYGGHPIWRVEDVVSLGDGSLVNLSCWTTDGAAAAAVVNAEDWGKPRRAWLVDVSGARLVPIDAATVRCEVLED